MKFTQITLQNFGRIKEATVKLSDRGLVLIQGQNMDGSAANSNGAGKSTLVEAISWVLYGKTAKGVTGDSVINREAGKNCAVHLTIEDGDESYTISRGRKHKVLKSKLHVTTGDGKVDLTKGTDKLTQDVVNKIIGCPYDVFVAAVYAGQEAVPDLPGMGDKQLKLLIEEAAGITELEEAYVKARADAQDIGAEYERAAGRVERADTGIEHARIRMEDAERSAKRWEGERDARLMDIETQAKTSIEEAKRLKEALGKDSPLKELNEQLDKAMVSKGKLDQEAETEDDHKTVLKDAERVVTGVETKIGMVKTQLKKAKDYEKEVEGQMGQPCEACGRDHDETSLEKTIEYAKGKVQEVANEARALIAELKDAQRSAQSARESLEKYQAGMTDPTHLEAHIGALRAKIKERTDQEAEVVRAKKTAQEALDLLKAERARENPYLPEIKDRKSDLSEAVKKRTEAEKARKEIMEEAKIAKGVVEVFSPKGVRARILDTVTPYLNERTAHYLGVLGDGRLQARWSTISLTAKGEAREKFAIDASDLEDGGNFADLSGGEKRRVRLACALALQDLVATRAAKAIDLFVADEIDAALDVAGLERLMTVLEEKGRERGSVIVISHTDLRDWCSNTITVRRENGTSKVIE